MLRRHSSVPLLNLSESRLKISDLLQSIKFIRRKKPKIVKHFKVKEHKVTGRKKLGDSKGFAACVCPKYYGP